MAWRTIADSEVDPESPVTTSLAIAWRDNPIAIAEKAAGAPVLANDYIVQAMVSNSTIGQGELKTTNGTVSLTRTGNDGNGTSTALRTLPGGAFGFYPEHSVNNNSIAGKASARMQENRTTTLSENPYVWLSVEVTGFDNVNDSMTITFRQTYVQASPPYDMGDGECGLFVEVDVLKNGWIAGLYVSPDPVWANSGPTNIRHDRIDNTTGKKYKSIIRPALTRDDLITGRCDLDEYLSAQKEASVEEIEVTAEFKRSDMEIVPHSWAEPPQGTICLLDPVNTHDLLALHEAGEDVADLVHKGYIQIGDECKRCGPPGVVPVTWKWRNSR